MTNTKPKARVFKWISASTPQFTYGRLYTMSGGNVFGDNHNKYTLPIRLLSGHPGPDENWEEVTEEVGEHYMVTILFPGSAREYDYRTAIEFEVGERFEMKRGNKLCVVRVVQVSPPKEDKRFRHKWITFVPKLSVYEAEV